MLSFFYQMGISQSFKLELIWPRFSFKMCVLKRISIVWLYFCGFALLAGVLYYPYNQRKGQFKEAREC